MPIGDVLQRPVLEEFLVTQCLCFCHRSDLGPHVCVYSWQARRCCFGVREHAGWMSVLLAPTLIAACAKMLRMLGPLLVVKRR